MTTAAELAMLTHAQKSALKWLRNRNADGMFDKCGVLVAAGERAPVMRSTWTALERAGVVTRYGGVKQRRLRVTPIGMAIDLSRVRESENYDEDEPA